MVGRGCGALFMKRQRHRQKEEKSKKKTAQVLFLFFFRPNPAAASRRWWAKNNDRRLVSPGRNQFTSVMLYGEVLIVHDHVASSSSSLISLYKMLSLIFKFFSLVRLGQKSTKTKWELSCCPMEATPLNGNDWRINFLWWSLMIRRTQRWIFAGNCSRQQFPATPMRGLKRD